MHDFTQYHYLSALENLQNLGLSGDFQFPPNFGFHIFIFICVLVSKEWAMDFSLLSFFGNGRDFGINVPIFMIFNFKHT